MYGRQPETLEEFLAVPGNRSRVRRDILGFDEPNETTAPVPMEVPKPDSIAPPADLHPEDAFTSMARRYLEARDKGRSADRLSGLNEGFKDATETILSPRGVRLGRGAPPPSEEARARQAYQDELGAAKTQLAASKTAKVDDRNDPKSQASINARALLKVNFPSLTDEELANVTAANAHDFGILRGQSMQQLQNAGNKAADIEEKGKDRKVRLQELALKGEALNMARNNFASMLGFRYEDMDAENQRHVDSLIAAKEARDAAKAQKDTEITTGQAKDFGTAYAASGLPEFYEQLDKAEALFAKYPSSLPGVGLAAGRIPRRFSSSDGGELRSIAGQMLLAYKKSVTGLGSSAKEDEAIREATGLIQTGDDASIRQGVRLLKDAMNAKADALKAPYRPEAVDQVTGRLKRPPGPRRKPVVPVPTVGTGAGNRFREPAGTTGTAPVKVRVRQKSTGKMRDLTPEAAATALTDPDFEKV